ncbi:MAG: (2Fe-2S) ferredoxin domain-containing protein [candidate division KSB1 bacterium]|nr:(2Fe-2S) ferredoxin domain-containing protein [candidate division KSB1 bacterium]MDZ7305124.1 (2Fe-2S) ferredoxin domain-containing protein [candidate division KSB1 bacterium]MDZ7314356.1 (2Fe-2S) ferredoxin domain-containing protein [candidate division KSB1 bacterium]
MSRFERHVFICTNVRPPDNPKGCCAARGSEAIVVKFKEELHKRGLNSMMRINKAGCLDACELGVSVVVYPDGVWYGRVTLDDVDEILESHLIGGKPVARLRVPEQYWRKPAAP